MARKTTINVPSGLTPDEWSEIVRNAARLQQNREDQVKNEMEDAIREARQVASRVRAVLDVGIKLEYLQQALDQHSQDANRHASEAYQREQRAKQWKRDRWVLIKWSVFACFVVSPIVLNIGLPYYLNAVQRRKDQDIISALQQEAIANQKPVGTPHLDHKKVSASHALTHTRKGYK